MPPPPKAGTLLYGVSPIGFGHASRAAAVGLKLRDRSLEPEFATGGPAVEFLRSYGFKVHDIVTEPVPSESGGEMKRVTLWYLRYWSGYRSTKKGMAELIKKLNPSLIVGDEEFSSVSLALELGIPNVMISDELELGFARGAVAKRIEARVGRWYSNLQRNVSHLLVPTFGADRDNIHYVSPITREVTKTREATRREYDLPLDSNVVLFSASGSGIGRFLLLRSLEAFRKVRTPSGVFAIAESHDPPPSHNDNAVRPLGMVRDNQNLIAAADLVISTAGKSTIDESISSGTPIISIPIKNHAEQEKNAAEIGFKFEDIDNLEELIPKLVGKRTEPARYSGAERVADFLATLLRNVA
jgi:UDP-N-acetylglucosamine--N-acetylmuramyl-(pentapeptide) pyrophosphoryl-undecaprenol N-acetylglucosamine transferase